MMKDSPPTMGVEVPEQASGAPEPTTTRSNKKKWMWIGLAAFAVVVAASVTTGVVVSNNNQNREKPVESSSVMTAPQFSQSKAAIDLLCGDEASKTECEAECDDVPDCCSIGESSCLVSELEGCVRYAKCQVLQELEEAAPENLAELCALEDKTQCTAACASVSCCYTDTEECDSSLYFLTCLDYAPCQNLKTVEEGETLVTTAPAGLDEICSLTGDEADRAKCESTCEAASCCWSTDDTEEENCLQDNWVTCLTYASCGSLVLPEANVMVPEAPEDLYNITCNLDEIWNGGDRASCEAACEQASCCSAPFNDTSATEENCFLDDPIGCLEYVSCALLEVTGGSIPRAPEDLSETCSWGAIGNATSEQACMDACEPAKCCTDSEDENCFSDGNALTCLEYAPCAILIIVGGDDVVDPPPELKDTCSRDAVREDAQPCRDLCEAGAGCCIETDDLAANCMVGNIDKCAAWSNDGCWRLLFA